MLSQIPTKTKVSIITSILIGSSLGYILTSIPRPDFIESYKPARPTKPIESSVATNWTQLVLHAKVYVNNNYTSILEDLDTHQKYQISFYPDGEYWDVQIINGVIKKATRERIHLTCAQAQSMTFFPNIYDVSDCGKGRTNIPGKKYYNPRH